MIIINKTIAATHQFVKIVSLKIQTRLRYFLSIAHQPLRLQDVPNNCCRA